MSTADETVTVRTAGPSTTDGVDPEPDVDRDRYVGLGADAIELPGASGRPEPPEREPEAGLALSLSGGGSRALLFHTGAIWRMNELGLLPVLERISGVSGGSIAAGILAKRSQDLGFNADGVSKSLETTFVAEVRQFATKTIDRRVIAELLLPRFRRGGARSRVPPTRRPRASRDFRTVRGSSSTRRTCSRR